MSAEVFNLNKFITESGGPAAHSLPARPTAPSRDFDLLEWAERNRGHLPPFRVKTSTQYRRLLVLETCPFNESHTGTAHIHQEPGGKLGAGCKHNSCTWGWKELRAKVEPRQEPQKALGSTTEPLGWLAPAAELSSTPAPIAWLVKPWLPTLALIMVHGPSGCGKTFVVLDWCLRIACSLAEWCGQSVRGGRVVYLAGEGHHGIRGRLAAWLQVHQPAKTPALWVSRTGCDLNTPEGYALAAEAIRDLPGSTNLIVVDTLHRFLAGDENSATDTKTMLDACAALMAEFNCSIILVHHTGVSEETQHRARGSSAWRGALDVEISVVPAKTKGGSIRLVQRKMKDAELAEDVCLELRSVPIHGWFDDDGEQVASAVPYQVDAPKKQPKPLSSADRFGMDTFREAASTLGRLTDEGVFDGVHLEDWRPIFYAMNTSDSQDAKQKAFARTRKALVDRGELRVADDVYYLGGAGAAIIEQGYARDLQSARTPGQHPDNTRTLSG